MSQGASVKESAVVDSGSGSVRPKRKLSKRPAKRYESGNARQKGRTERLREDVARLGLDGMVPRRITRSVAKCFDKLDRAEAEDYKGKLERKYGLLKKPWERVEMAGHIHPSSSSDDELGHAVSPKYTRSLFDLSPGHLKDDNDDAEEEEGNTTIVAKKPKKEE